MAPAGPSIRAVAAGLAAAAGLWWIGELFGLNGRQWDWWQWASFAGAGVTIAAFLLRSAVAAVLAGRGRLGLGLTGMTGAISLGASLALMASRYSDPYDGRLLWPHVLAVVGLIGFTLIVAAAVACGHAR